jgi:hypothetical protein
MGVVKYDYPPLLAPGRHFLSLVDIEALCVHRFSGTAQSCRATLFYALEEFIQRILVAKIRCDVFVDGSFLTEKPHPDDVDVMVITEHGVVEALTDGQMGTLRSINDEPNLCPGVDAMSFTSYPRDHVLFGSALDVANPGEIYGLEHSRVWLKGYVVVRVWETDVRNRICR